MMSSMRRTAILLLAAVTQLVVAQSRLEQLCKEAQEKFDARDFQAAAEKAEQALKLDSLSTEAHRVYQDVKRQGTNAGEITAWYLDRVQGYPHNAVYAYLYSRVLREQVDSMRLYLRRSIQLNPKYYWGYIGLASTLWSKKETAQEALGLLDRAEAIKPATELVRNHRALACLTLERYDDAFPVIHEMYKMEASGKSFNFNTSIDYIGRAYKGLLKSYGSAGRREPEKVRVRIDEALTLYASDLRVLNIVVEALRPDSLFAIEMKLVQEVARKARENEIAAKRQEFQRFKDARSSTRLKELHPKAINLLKGVNETFSSLRSLYAERRSTTLRKTGFARGSSEIDHVMAMRRPDKIRIEAKRPSGELTSLTIFDGQTLWTGNSTSRQYKKSAAAPVPDDKEHLGMMTSSSEVQGTMTTIANALTIPIDRLAVAKIMREEKIDISGSPVECTVLALDVVRPASETTSYDQSPLTMWIDKARQLPVQVSFNRIHFNPRSGDLTEVDITQQFFVLRTNEHVPDILFVFAPPSDWKEVEEFGSETTRTNLAGTMAPPFILKDLEENDFELTRMRGKVVLLDFWATWCGPCRIELPHIEKLHKEFKGKGLVVAGINDEDRGLARKFLQENRYTFVTLSDTQRGVARSYRVNAIPTVFILDKAGVISSHFVGMRSETELRAALKKVGIE